MRVRPDDLAAQVISTLIERTSSARAGLGRSHE
jgi:hypothetical protein